MDELRSSLYYLGFLSSFAFGIRFIIQWIQSEKKKETIVPRSFWQFSLGGNLALVIHSFIQVQYHVCLIQGLNAVISLRNLSLMRPRKVQPPLSRVFLWMFATAVAITVGFVVQDYFLFDDPWDWFRTPSHKWQTQQEASLPFAWHAIGFASYALFSSRFWVQWLEAEKNQRSDLGLSFWWLSLAGAILSVIYFLSMHDLVNAVGPGLGLIPYTRNLMLIYKSRRIPA